MYNNNIKNNAKKCLSNNWSQAILVCFLPILVLVIELLVVTIITDINALFIDNDISNATEIGNYINISLSIFLISICFFLFLVLCFGVYKYFWNKSVGIDDVGLIFSVFKKNNYVKNFVASSNFFISFSFLFYIFFAIATFIYNTVVNSTWFAELTSIQVGLLTVAFVSTSLLVLYVIIIYTQMYFLFPYIFFSNPDVSIMETMRISKMVMHGRKVNSAKFVLSFLPMFALCLLIFPIIYVIPYYMQSRSEYAKIILEDYAQSISEKENSKQLKFGV